MRANSPWTSWPEYSVPVTPEDLQTALARALATVRPGSESEWKDFTGTAVEAAGHSSRGDWSTSIALRAAGGLAEPAWTLAADIAAELSTLAEVACAEVAGPGFINITLTPAARAQIACDILTSGPGFGAPFSAAASPGAAENLDAETSSGTGATPAASGEACETIDRLRLAHAAAHRTDRRAIAAGMDTADFDSTTLAAASESTLLNRLAAVPGASKRSRRDSDPHVLAAALLKAAEAFEDFSSACTVVPTIDNAITTTHATRLVLVRAVISVLAAGLRQLGASAPERM